MLEIGNQRLPISDSALVDNFELAADADQVRDSENPKTGPGIGEPVAPIANPEGLNRLTSALNF